MMEGGSPAALEVAYKIPDAECFRPCRSSACLQNHNQLLLKRTNSLFFFFILVLVIFFATKDVRVRVRVKDGRHIIVHIDAVYS